MYLAADTPRGMIRKMMIENATDDQVTVIPAHFFGDIYLIGEEHKEAAEFLREKIADCKTNADEIRLHVAVEEKFHVALLNKQEGKAPFTK